MKRITLASSLAALAMSAAALGGCSETPNDTLTVGGAPVEQSVDPTSLAAAENTQHHFKDTNTGENGIVSAAEVRAQDQKIGTPVEVARYHACAKLTYSALGSILDTRGVPATASARTIYKGGGAALGVANYPGRVSEAIVASTSAMAKQFDIFIAAAPDVQKNLKTSTGCAGTEIVDAQGKFSKDGLSCIMGKLATDEHAAVANQAVADAVKGGATQDQGVQIAIAAALEASHTCE